jgi:hypothetical protein
MHEGSVAHLPFKVLCSSTQHLSGGSKYRSFHHTGSARSHVHSGSTLILPGPPTRAECFSGEKNYGYHIEFGL